MDVMASQGGCADRLDAVPGAGGGERLWRVVARARAELGRRPLPDYIVTIGAFFVVAALIGFAVASAEATDPIVRNCP